MPSFMGTLTSPPPRRPPEPRHPTFTTDVFSTKSFGPGHLLGLGILGVGIYGITKYFVNRSRETSGEARRGLASSPPILPNSQLARVENVRGTYGK